MIMNGALGERRRCKLWALPGGNQRCYKHSVERRRQLRRRVRNDHLPRFYSKFLTKTLSEAVEEQLDLAPTEQLRFFEELALMRDVAGQAVMLYGAAKATGKAEHVMPAAMVMKDALSEVVKIGEAAARIEASARDKISVHALHCFVAQIVRIVHDTFGDDPRVHQFEEAIRNSIRLPVAVNSGTARTPDADAIEMDDTIPMLPPPSRDDASKSDDETDME